MSPDVPSTMGAGEFKNRCLAVLDEVAATRRPVVITKRGLPVARVIPEGPAAGDDLFGDLARRGWRLAPRVDLVAPIIPAEEWAEMDREREALMRGDLPP
jgi:prevent-host-death family protein